MRRSVAASAVVLALAGTPADAQPPAVHLTFLSPRHGETVMGRVAVEVEVLGEGVEEVVLWVDDREAGRLSGPPYRFEVALGDDLGPHRFEAVALADGAQVARAVRETRGLVVDDRVELELTQLYVTVEGRRSAALAATDFRVTDDGIRQRIVTFEDGDAPLTVALLVDASDSMRGGRLDAALAGARSFIAGMRPLDEASVVLFADGVVAATPVMSSGAELESVLAGVEAAGGTALNDALYLALRQLEARQGRRVVVLLSDGVDVHSVLDVDDVEWTMARSRSVVYWIALGGESADRHYLSPWRDRAEHDRELAGLSHLVRDSGGRVLPIADAAEAAAAFAEILAELRRQYVLGYYPTVDRDDGRWHEVAVKVRRPGMRARTRGGYVDD